MIRLTRLNQVSLVLNSDLIEHIEMTPDTVISMTSGQKFMVRETSEQVIDRVIQFRRQILTGMCAYSWPARPLLQTSINKGDSIQAHSQFEQAPPDQLPPPQDDTPSC